MRSRKPTCGQVFACEKVVANVAVECDVFAQGLAVGTVVFFGPFRSRGNDAERAVTLDLPDRDGVVRAHLAERPHCVVEIY